MARKPLEWVESEVPMQDIDREENPVDEIESNTTPTLATETLVYETPVNEGEVLVADEPSTNIPNNSTNDSSPTVLISENSAVNCISNLVDQLRDKPGVPRAVERFAKSLAESDLDSRLTQVIPDGATDGSATILLEDSAGSDSESRVTWQLATPLATCASLEVNDCAAFAYRAYYCVFLGCASSLFSIVLAIMSPHATTLGFVVSMAAFSLALGLGLKYRISFRAFVNKSAQALTSPAKAIDPTMSIS